VTGGFAAAALLVAPVACTALDVVGATSDTTSRVTSAVDTTVTQTVQTTTSSPTVTQVESTVQSTTQAVSDTTQQVATTVQQTATPAPAPSQPTTTAPAQTVQKTEKSTATRTAPVRRSVSRAATPRPSIRRPAPASAVTTTTDSATTTARTAVADLRSATTRRLDSTRAARTTNADAADGGLLGGFALPVALPLCGALPGGADIAGVLAVVCSAVGLTDSGSAGTAGRPAPLAAPKLDVLGTIARNGTAPGTAHPLTFRRRARESGRQVFDTVGPTSGRAPFAGSAHVAHAAAAGTTGGPAFARRPAYTAGSDAGHGGVAGESATHGLGKFVPRLGWPTNGTDLLIALMICAWMFAVAAGARRLVLRALPR
jgi:hypothetical protein